jgi:hypothetical protein
MTCHHRRQRPHRGKEINLPIIRHQRPHRPNTRQHNHRNRHAQTPNKSEPKLPQNHRHFHEETRIARLLARSTPRHVDAAEMADDRLGDVQADPTQEDCQHGDPGEVLEEGAEEGFLFHSVAEDSEREIAERAEDEYDREVDLEAVDVVVV